MPTSQYHHIGNLDFNISIWWGGGAHIQFIAVYKPTNVRVPGTMLDAQMMLTKCEYLLLISFFCTENALEFLVWYWLCPMIILISSQLGPSG